ncbi:MAG: AAA family ATPase [Methanosarcinaceae archaeon]|nr:AAA family ATPase [Methanosarcinaceae archaeon]
MRVDVKNFGIIENAEIELNGLTIIAGENDSGKSTFGKIMFTLFHTLQNYKEDFKKEKVKAINSLISQVAFILSSRNDEAYEDFRRLEINSANLGPEQLEKHTAELCKKIKENGEYDNLVLAKIDEIEKVNGMKLDDTETKKRFVEKAFYFAFHDQIINPCLCDGPKIEVFRKNEEPEIKLEISPNNKSMIYYEKEDALLFKDVVFVGTTSFFEFGDIVKYADTEDVPEYVRDIVYKIERASFKGDMNKFGIDSEFTTEFEPAEFIADIILGEMKYDIPKNDFYYTKTGADESNRKDNEKNNDKNKVFTQAHRARNTASGIKTFGIIQMLSKYGFMKAGNLIIIDEPEAHLHPMWQILFAELLVKLREKTGVTILLSTHSTYFIEALKVYSEKYEIENQTEFYFAKKDTIFCSTIKNVTSDLEIIFETLALPFEKLDEVDMDFDFD